MSALPALRPGSGQACALPRAARHSTTLYRSRRPEKTVVYQVVQQNLETWLKRVREAEPDSDPVPRFVERDLRNYLDCGILAHGFARARCGGCGHDFLIAYSCKGRGICPSCNTRRMAETAAHLVDHVFPRVPVRQWVLSLPKRLRAAGPEAGPIVMACYELTAGLADGVVSVTSFLRAASEV